MVAALALVSAGCGAEDSRAGDAAGRGGAGGDAGVEGAGGQGDGGAPAFEGTGGLTDNPVDQLFANPQRNAWDVLGTDAAAANTYADAARACYASPDTCDDAECGAYASCCVNNGTCCEPIVDDPPLPALLDFQKCAGQTVSQCAEGVGSTAVAFSQIEPVLSGRGLIPNGTATAEGGALIGEPVDLSSQRTQVDVQFTLPVGCGGTCLESAGVAFTGTPPGAFVAAEVGLLLSGSRHAVNLMIGDAVADSFDAGTDDTRWRLVLSPAGSVRLFRDGTPLGSYAFDAASLKQARLVTFGRNLGAAATSAAIAVLEVESSFCDSPRSWQDRQPLSITLNGNEVPGHASGSGPSIVDHAATRRMAYVVDDEIFLAEQEAPGEFFLNGPSPALVPTESYEAMGVGDPELVWDGNVLLLFYTAWDAKGAGSIGAAVSVQDVPLFMKGQGPVLAPTGDVISYEAPSVVYRDGLWLLIVRATLGNGSTELRAFYTSDVNAGWERVINGTLEELTRIEDATAEITDPSLVIHNSAYHLYYARRTGTRWSVELAVSDELLLWRPVGEVLGGSGEGFDRLGARSPDALSLPDRIDVVYAGQDGVSFPLGTAWRAAPSATAPSIF
jgi:predicted GH43/DUF377 family glycosyl hydrolase